MWYQISKIDLARSGSRRRWLVAQALLATSTMALTAEVRRERRRAKAAPFPRPRGRSPPSCTWDEQQGGWWRADGSQWRPAKDYRPSHRRRLDISKGPSKARQESLQRRRLPGAQLMLAARNCVARRHLALLGPRCGKIVKVDARRAACPNHMPPARPSHPARPTHRTHTHPHPPAAFASGRPERAREAAAESARRPSSPSPSFSPLPLPLPLPLLLSLSLDALYSLLNTTSRG